MSLNKKELLYQLAEEAAYSFKGHMKTADWIGVAIAFYIFIPMVTSLLVLIFSLPSFWQKIASLFGFLFAALALNSSLANNRRETDQIVRKHMELGNRYLALYNEIKVIATDIENLNQVELSQLQQKIDELNTETNRLRIGFVGRWWSKWKIRTEMDLDWLYKDNSKSLP